MVRKRRWQRRWVVKTRVPEQCHFCTSDKDPSYKDPEQLKAFTSERGKLLGKAKTGICSKHQRQLTKAVKRARFLSLLPFVVRPS